jgi:hypothetical protein
MANNRGCEEIFVYILLFIFIGYKLFKWLQELYYENYYVKGIIDWIFIIIGFIVIGQIFKYFRNKKPTD